LTGMSCEIYIDSNAEEYEIGVSGDDTCAEFEVIVELEGETIPTETDPVFLAHPVYGMDASDVSNLHAPYSDAETLSTIGTLLDTAATGSPASGDSFPWIEAVGHTQKKITYGSLMSSLKSYFDTIYQPIS